MLVSVIKIKNKVHAELQMERSKNLCDAFEFRLDYAKKIDFSGIGRLRNLYNLPIIFTLRKKSQGGFYSGHEDQRLKDLQNLCELSPDFLDMEYDTPVFFIKKIHKLYPNIKLICSFHDFEQTPLNLKCILNKMIQKEFSHYKIATFAQKTSDALRMLSFVQSNANLNLSGICMGTHGIATRILGPIKGNQFNFGAFNVDEGTAPGQLSLDELNHTYNFKHLNRQTKIFALIGDPVDKSLGHIFHNYLIRTQKQNSVYLKLKTSQQELPEVLNLCALLKFSGFSVTMPLKESILPYLDVINETGKKINAVNTIVVDENDRWKGFNTDGMGAMFALKAHVPNLKDQKIVLLGAGGSAKAIAQAALDEGAKVLILNRTLSKAIELADAIGCLASQLKNLAQIKNEKYSILINTLPLEMLKQNKSEFKFDTKDFIPNTVVMDIVYNPVETKFLKKARKANCICIPGIEMFIQQALLQAKLFGLSHPTALLPCRASRGRAAPLS